MEATLRKKAQTTLERLGVAVGPKVGRPPLGLAPGEEIWVLGEGEAAPQVLATPYGAGAHPGDPVLDLPRLWVAEHFAAATAARLIADGDGIVDAAGNVHLGLPGIVIRVTGKWRPRTKQPVEGPAYREWRGPAIRVLFQLLCNPGLAERPVREIAKAGNAAPGTVVHLLKDMERMGHLVRLGGHKRRFVPDQGLVDMWRVEYERKLRPKLLLGRFTAAIPDWWRTFPVAEQGAVWGAETAATLLGADLLPGVTTIYIRVPLAKLLRAARLRPDLEGRVEVRKAFWTNLGKVPREDVAPPLLVVADLLATRDGRCLAAAKQVREAYPLEPVRQK